MTTTLRAPALTDLDGIPFLDDDFASTRLLAMTAAIRYAHAQRRELGGGLPRSQAEAWLGPSRAYLLSTASTRMPAQPLTPGRRQQIGQALDAAGTAMPAWVPLLVLPIRYAELRPANGAISASSRDWPQHVLLAADAFTTGRELREQLVHELAHQWLYLIEDIWPLQDRDAEAMTLPSGTRDRTPAEVIGAAHVAAALIRMYRQDTAPQSAARVRDLTAYGRACLGLADGSGALTEAGTQIAQRLKEML